MLQVTDLHTYYGNIQALKGVSLNVNAGEIVCLIGSNGAGKTTTLRTIQGLIKPRQGSILFEGKPLEQLSPRDIVRLGIAQSPEGRLIFPRMTVAENLEMGAFYRKDTSSIRSDLEDIFHRFPRLKERLKQKGGTLSGGEQQMLAIARALMSRPKLLLLDEPSLGLAPAIVREIFSIIKKLRETGVTILLVEQNANLALQAADRGYVLEAGRITLTGKASQLLDDERVKQAYLG